MSDRFQPWRSCPDPGLPDRGSELWALQRGERMKWLVVQLSIVWANIHGSFPLAVAFAGVFALDSFLMSDRRQALGYVALTIATALSTLATPYGPEVWRYTMAKLP